MDGFKVGQLTKELVSAKLRAMDDPCAAAAAIVHATLGVAFSSGPADAQVQALLIEDACRGGMTGLVLTEQNTAKGAVLMLRRVVEVAGKHGIDPTAAMQSALKGIADIRRFMLPDRMLELRYAVDAEFMGAGDCLRAMLDEAARAEKQAA